MENIFVEFLPPWVETGLQPAFYDKESGTVLQQTARMYARVNMLIRMFNKLSKNTKEEVERFEGTVNTKIENFERDVNTTVGDYIERFNTLSTYVHDYFDNLDVQQEINNKLDQMLEDGVLEKIITSYLDSNIAWTYDSVAEMQTATNLQPESYAQTYGYYAVGDGGGAKYNVRNPEENEVPNNITTFAVGNYIAELVIEPVMYVKQFGCKGDGLTDDTARFNTAISNSKKLYINDGNYLIERFLPTQYRDIEGLGQAKLTLTGSTAPLCQLASNLKLSNITIESNKADLAWNRCNISNNENISIENCTIKGFKHNSTAPNAWGILIGNSTNINISSCYFDDNSQSDIALVNGCKDITIDKCKGTHFFINVEPDGITYKNNNISIKNSELEKLAILENNYLGTATENMLVSNCTIGKLIYDGGTATIENCIVNDIAPQITSNVAYGGILNLVNTMNLSKNILTDPYFDQFHNWKDSTKPWRTQYISDQLGWTMTTVKDSDGVLTLFNPDGRTNISGIIEHQLIDVTAGDKFILRVNTKAKYPTSGVNYASLNYCATWVDSGNSNISTVVLSMNRGAIGTTTKMCEQSAVLVAPENAVKLRITIRLATSPNTLITGSQSLYLRSIELLKFNGGENPNTIPKLPIRDKRIFDSDSIIGATTYNKYYAGDTLYYTTPTTYIGAVATADGYGSDAKWKNFGALAS